MTEYLEKVLIVGNDHPKINMLCDFISEAQRASFRDKIRTSPMEVQLIYGESGLIRSSKNVMTIESRYIPYGICVVADLTGGNWLQKDYGQVIMMQPYPFTLGNINNDLNSIKEHLISGNHVRTTSYKVMFYRDINQQSGYGDLVDIDKALGDAPRMIQNELNDPLVSKLISYRTYRRPSDIVSILHGGRKNLNALAEICKEDFERFKFELEYFTTDFGEYKDKLYYYNELTSETELGRITSFSSVKGSYNVTTSYIDQYISRNSDKVAKFSEDVYRSTISDIGFWDIDRDVMVLRSKVVSLIKKELIKETLFETVPCPSTEALYNSIIRNEKHLDTQFASAVVRFIESTLMNFIFDYLKRKEKILSRPYIS